MTLRDIAEFDLRYRMLSVPGVASVERLGGQLRQYQVLLDSGRMRALAVTLDDVMRAVGESSVNAPGGFVTQGATEFSIRGLGRVQSPDDLRESVITSRDGVPVKVSDVATVVEAGAIRRGLAHANGREVVSSRLIKQFGADTVQVTEGIRKALEEFQKTLPRGVRLRTVYDQSDLVQHALGTVIRAILIGAALVALVLFVLLGDTRSALIVTTTLSDCGSSERTDWSSTSLASAADDRSARGGRPGTTSWLCLSATTRPTPWLPMLAANTVTPSVLFMVNNPAHAEQERQGANTQLARTSLHDPIIHLTPISCAILTMTRRQSFTRRANVTRDSEVRRSGAHPGTSEPGAPVFPPGGVTPPSPPK